MCIRDSSRRSAQRRRDVTVRESDAGPGKTSQIRIVGEVLIANETDVTIVKVDQDNVWLSVGPARRLSDGAISAVPHRRKRKARERHQITQLLVQVQQSHAPIRRFGFSSHLIRNSDRCPIGPDVPFLAKVSTGSTFSDAIVDLF